jgi:hypothetical protein
VIDDFDEAYLAAARRASELRERSRSSTTPPPRPFAVPIQAEPVPGTRAFSLENVGPGWPLYPRPIDGFTDYDVTDSRAGVCVEVMHDQVADPETGELWPRTRYRCLASWRPSAPWRHLEASEVDLARLNGIDQLAITAGVRFLLRPVVQSRRKWLTGRDVEAVADAGRLVRAWQL